MFISPTKGRLSWEELLADIISYVTEAADYPHTVIVGTDSQVREQTCLVTAVVVHRQGKGARYYYQKKYQRKILSLRQRIFYEAALSLELAGRVADYFRESGFQHLNIEIHLDVGTRGDTKEMIRELVGMVTGSGFDAKIKPDASGASKVADKHTK